MNPENTVHIMPIDLIPIVAISLSALVGIVVLIAYNIRRGVERRAMEESRREISAYVAEGSMTVDQAERLLNAGPKACSDPSPRRM